MATSLLQFFKSLLVSEDNTLTPSSIEIVPNGSPSTKLTITSTQTSNATVDLKYLAGVSENITDTYVRLDSKGVADGVASLDNQGKIPSSQLPVSAMEWKGNWDASTNSPSLADGVGSAGDVYRVDVAGTQNLGSGNITFTISDWVVYSGSVWQKAPAPGAVSSVFGRTGDIVAQSGDYTKSQVGLGNVDNTADVDKPVSTAQQTAITTAKNEAIAAACPTGTILLYPGYSAPTGFLVCNGNAISRTTYAALFSLIGTQYGVGDGSTTFNLPNFQGRVPVGQGFINDGTFTGTRLLGVSGGTTNHYLTVGEMPAHDHGGLTGSHKHSILTDSTAGDLFVPISDDDHVIEVISNQGGDFSYNLSGRQNGLNPNIGKTSFETSTIASQGSGNFHNNMQPYLVVNYIIKT